ncbi:helix-turn-helix domain-containing protein [Streptomyces sp. NPDC002125]
MGTEIQDFAELLRGLKERSGLSYGTLAQKLHMSTSTVHRYCNGDAVPHEYAPVERFARVCRASSEELVALHRKWILADEAKRRGVRRPEAAAASPEAETAAVAQARPEAVAEPVAAAETEPVARPEAEADSEPRTKPGAEVESGPGAESFPQDVTPGAPHPGDREPGRRRPTRRTRVLLTAVAVVALTVPAALAVRGLAGDGPSDDGRTQAEPSVAQIVPSGRVSGSAKPGKGIGTSAKPSEDTTAPDGGSSSSATPSASSGATAGSGVPVNATISSYNWESPCGQYYLLDQDPDDVPPNPPSQDSRSWARALGGVDGGDMKLELTLQGKSEEAVVLNALHVRVLGREAALPWNAYSMGNGCGGGITPQTFDIDLDDSRPRSKPVAGEDAGVVVPAKDFPYRVSSTDVEVFHLDAHVEGHDVTWYLELEWTSGGRSGKLRIDDQGKPFRTSSIATRPEYYYRPDTAQWVPAED